MGMGKQTPVGKTGMPLQWAGDGEQADDSWVLNLTKEKSIKIDTNTFVDKDNLFEWPDLNNSVDKDGFCYALKTHIGILSDGTVVPCCLDRDGVIDLGNIFKESLDDILNKKITKDIIDGFKNNKAVHPLCKKCNFRDRFI